MRYNHASQAFPLGPKNAGFDTTRNLVLARRSWRVRYQHPVPISAKRNFNSAILLSFDRCNAFITLAQICLFIG